MALIRALPTPAALGVLALALCAGACQTYPYQPERATRAYPAKLKQVEVVNIQVIPDVGSGMITVVNATAVTYSSFDLWINRRYMRHLDELRAGQSLELDIESFWDERGEGPFPGGWLRYYQATPIVLAQIQTAPDRPLVGLSAMPSANQSR